MQKMYYILGQISESEYMQLSVKSRNYSPGKGKFLFVVSATLVHTISIFTHRDARVHVAIFLKLVPTSLSPFVCSVISGFTSTSNTPADLF